MQMPQVLLASLALLAASEPGARLAVAHPARAGEAPTAAAPRAADVQPLDLGKLYVVRDGGLAVAPEVEALRGRAVRVRGFMVQMEEAPRGEFYLATHPVEQDESGAGTGDLPVGAVLVRVPGLAQPVPWRPHPVEVVGTLEVGREEEADGRVTWLRVVMAEPSPG
jgi:hypothetical protein